MNQTLESMLVESCAPTLAGIKPANLFRCTETPELFPAMFAWNRKLRPGGLQIRVLKRCRRTGSCLIYVCRRAWVQQVLVQQAVQDFLSGQGYDMAQGMEHVLCQLSRRLCVRSDFPHEIGIFLGYPLRDVIGFIQNQGQNYTCCGHWKCYGDAEEAQKIFDSYRSCTACYKRMFETGIPLLALIAAA